MKKILWGIYFPLLLLLVGCTNKNTISTLQVTDVRYDTRSTAGAQMQVQVSIASPAEFDNVPIAFAAFNTQTPDQVIEIDEGGITSLISGTQTYTVALQLPQNIEAGDYTLIANIDPSDSLGDWNDTLQFSEGATLVRITPPDDDDVTLSRTEDNTNEENTQQASYANNALGVAPTELPPVTINYTDENISIGLNALLRPTLIQAEQIDVTVNACLETPAGCTPIPLWQAEENGSLGNNLTLTGLEHGRDTLIAIDAVVMASQVSALVDTIRDQLLLDPLNFPSVNTQLKLTLIYGDHRKDYTFGLPFHPSEDLMHTLVPALPVLPVAPLPVNPLTLGASGQLRSSGSAACRPKVLHYQKTFKKYKYGKRFGAGVYVKGDAKLDSTGLHTTVNSIVKAKILGRKDRLMKLSFEAGAEPGSFENTGYDLTLDILKITVYSKSNSLAEAANMDTPEVTEVEEAEINAKIRRGDTNLSKATLMKQKVYKKAKKSVRTYSGSGHTNVGYAKTWDIGKRHGYSQQLVVGIVPITISAGAQATIGFEASIALTGITSLESTFTPNAKIGAYASGGVGTHGMSAGIEADLWLVHEKLENKVTASMVFGEDANNTYITEINGTIEETIINRYRGPNGKLYLYAEYPVPKYCRSFGHRYVCGYRKKHRRKYLGKWRSYRSNRILLRKKQNLFSIPLNDCN